MTKDLEIKLENKFPFMRRSKIEDERNIYKRWGIECEDGWYQLIHNLCQKITDRYNEDNIPIDIIVEQVKEKFATLRFYYSYKDFPCPIQAIDFLDSEDTIRLQPKNKSIDKCKIKLRSDIAQIVRDFENNSKFVCEFCGNNNGIIRMELPWIKTLCNDCYDKHRKKREERKQKLRFLRENL